jgi:hypothetical protein
MGSLTDSSDSSIAGCGFSSEMWPRIQTMDSLLGSGKKAWIARWRLLNALNPPTIMT